GTGAGGRGRQSVGAPGRAPAGPARAERPAGIGGGRTAPLGPPVAGGDGRGPGRDGSGKPDPAPRPAGAVDPFPEPDVSRRAAHHQGGRMGGGARLPDGQDAPAGGHAAGSVPPLRRVGPDSRPARAGDRPDVRTEGKDAAPGPAGRPVPATGAGGPGTGG